MWSTSNLGNTTGLNSLPVVSMILPLRIPSSMRDTLGGKSPTCSHCKMLLILASLDCSDLIDLNCKIYLFEECIRVWFDFNSFHNDLTYLKWGEFFKEVISKLCARWFSRYCNIWVYFHQSAKSVYQGVLDTLNVFKL